MELFDTVFEELYPFETGLVIRKVDADHVEVAWCEDGEVTSTEIMYKGDLIVIG